jgi:predicted MFS family arabinose efflux permease
VTHFIWHLLSDNDDEAVDENQNAVLAIQALRAALYGFGAVLLGEVLALRGFGPAQTGLVLTAIVAGMGVSSFLVGAIGPRLPTRSLYLGLLLLMGASGLVFAATAWLPALVVAGLTGTISTDPNESGPITTVEQGLIGRSDARIRLRLFGRYNAIAYLAGAVGSLAAAGAGLLQRSGHLILSTEALFVAFPIVAVACAALAMTVREQEVQAAAEPPRTKPSRKVVRLGSLFALDAFGGGFVTQAFIAYWLHVRFGAGPEQVGLVFFGSGLLQSGSSIAAARIASRAGELNVMVFTHLPSNLLLAAVAFAPSLTVAVVLLLARFALSQMDVPARQAFVAGLVPPQDRLGAAAYTNLARYLGRPLGPAVGGLLMRTLIGAPFLAAGLVKVVYDVALYTEFRREKLLD